MARKKFNKKASKSAKKGKSLLDFQQIDTDNMRGVLENFSLHCEHALKLGVSIGFTEYFGSIALCGMGGSAISGDLLRNVMGSNRIPVYTIRDYTLPDYINSKSLVFIASYSGNTEETLSAFEEALKRECKIVAISAGGKLEEMSIKNKIPHIKIPSGIQPRLATAYMFFPMFNVVRNSKIVDVTDDEIKNMLSFVRSTDFKKAAQNIAQKLNGKTPLIYSSPRFSAVAMKWKTDINENTKIHAFYNVYPEFNHNELNAYYSAEKNFHVVILRDENEHPRTLKRMKITAKLIKSKGVNVDEVLIKGNSMLAKVISTQYLGLWVSFYLAMMHKTNPTPVKIIEDLKKALG